LQARSDRLAPAEFEYDRQLASLDAEVVAARSGQDTARVERLNRKTTVIRRQRAQVSSEIKTLRELIEARLGRYGLIDTPADPSRPDNANQQLAG
jgi:hypothetical protein